MSRNACQPKTACKSSITYECDIMWKVALFTSERIEKKRKKKHEKSAIRRASQHKMTFCLITSGTLFATLGVAHDLHWCQPQITSWLFVQHILSIGTQNNKYCISLKDFQWHNEYNSYAGLEVHEQRASIDPEEIVFVFSCHICQYTKLVDVSTINKPFCAFEFWHWKPEITIQSILHVFVEYSLWSHVCEMSICGNKNRNIFCSTQLDRLELLTNVESWISDANKMMPKNDAKK